MKRDGTVDASLAGVDVPVVERAVDAEGDDAAYFRNVVESLAEGVIVQTPDGTVVTANLAAARLLGLDHDLLLGTDYQAGELRVVDADGRPMLHTDFPGRRCIETGTSLVGVVFGIVRADDSISWIELNAHPLFRHGGERPDAVVSTVRDVTDRILARQAMADAARRRELVLAYSADGYRILDASGNLLESNPPLDRESGFAAPGEGMFRHIDRDCLKQMTRMFVRVVQTAGAAESIDVKAHSLELGDRWFECNMTNYLDEPSVGGVVVNYRDITDRKLAEDSIRFQARLLDTAGQAIVANDAAGRIVFWNHAAVGLFGWSVEEAMGRRLTDLIRASRSSVSELMSMLAAVERGETWSGDLWIQAQGGRHRPIFQTTTPVFDDDGALLAMIGVSMDISDRKHSEDLLAHQAAHDPLTGLPNRLRLAGLLDQTLAETRRLGHHLDVLFVDVDHFKVINDGIGHATGDRVLCAAADRLRTVLPGHFVARFGGDEFVIVHTSGIDDVADVCDRVLDSFRHPFSIDGHELHLSVSIGVARATDDDTSGTLLRDADAAMYQAKDDGRAQVRAFDDTLRRRATDRLDLEMAMRRALERDEFRLHYQPIIRLDTGAVGGFEALLRWDQPELGSIPPDRFIPVAEETGLILPLGAWVIRRAVGQIVEWERTGVIQPGFGLAVNLSPRQLLDPSLGRDVAASLDSSHLQPWQLALEITETSLMHDVERSIRILHELRDIGVGLAVDDFGTGYSSLMYLKRFPVDVLKIDRSFVAGLGTDPNDTSIVHAVASLGDALDLAIVAEGVETEGQHQALRGLGCNYGQGYLWSPALHPDDVPEWIRGRPMATGARIARAISPVVG